MFRKKISAVKVPHHKNTAAQHSERLAPPPEVFLPLKNNSRAEPNIPLVAVGDHVYLGQLIAEENGKGTSHVHATVSGTVVSLDENVVTPAGVVPAIRIKSDGKMEKDPSIVVPEPEDLDGFLAACRASGIVGLGGAAFPLWSKYDAARKNHIKTILVNGAECEPYITSDHRTMLECPEDIKKGIEVLKKFLQSEEYIIGIESNKPDAIAGLTELFKDDSQVTIKTLKSVYPQGAKQVLLYNATGLVVQKGQRLASLGTIITNITTLSKMGQYFTDGMPLVEKCITVDGSAVKEPKNVIVPIGTPVQYLIDNCGGLKGEPGKIIFGGPMMGKTVDTFDAPVLKATNAVLVFAKEECTPAEPTDCIHCGKCVEACPLNLNPTAFAKALDIEDEDERAAVLRKEEVALCMSCGSCSFVCPAHRPIPDINNKAKGFLRKYDAAHADQEGGKR